MHAVRLVVKHVLIIGSSAELEALNIQSFSKVKEVFSEFLNILKVNFKFQTFLTILKSSCLVFKSCSLILRYFERVLKGCLSAKSLIRVLNKYLVC